MKFPTILCALTLALLLHAVPASLAVPTTPEPTVVPDQYIVTLKPQANLAQFSRALKAEIARERSAAGSRTKDDVLPEFAHQVSIGDGYKAVVGVFPRTMVAKLKAHGHVAMVEQDRILRPLETTQLDPQSWGLSRISRRRGNRGNYYFPDMQGKGVDVYVFDCGLRVDHPEFAGRRAFEAFRANDTWSADKMTPHGTFVAGIVAGAAHGVAKRANVHSIRICDKDGKGSWSDMIRGIEWVAQATRTAGKTAVCTFGSGAPVPKDYPYGTVDAAIERLFEAGCVVVKAAGNEIHDACYNVPARTRQGLTVAALAADGRTLDHSYTNYGTCVQISAPGTGVTSADVGGGSSAWPLLGTSAAAPYVAGAAALILGQERGLKPQEVVDRILAQASQGVIEGDLKGTPNRVVYVRN